MNIVNSFFQTCKPYIPKRHLLLVAALFWTFAGSMLLFRGFSILNSNSGLNIFEVLGSLISGMIFYKFMFSKISLKHINRILNLPTEKPCFLSFFNLRSYFLMTIMITFGITLRLSGIVPIYYLALFYIVMGTPLFMSAIRFYYHFYSFKNLN